MSSVVRRASWGLVDQVLSSGSNFALSTFVAATVDAAAFGAFTLVYGIYNLVVGFSGGLASVPLVVRYSAAPPDRYRAATRAAVGAALVAGTVAGAGCLAASSLTSSAIANPLRALGVMLPGLVVQDAWRYSFVTGGRPAKAAANDGLWIGLQLAGIAVVLAAGDVSAVSMVLVWGASGTAAAAFGCWQARVLPAPDQVLKWLREQRSLTWRYAGEAVVHRSGPWAALAVVGAVAGLRDVGALRGAMLIIGGPVQLLFMGTTFVFVAEGVRLLSRAPELLPRAVRGVSAAASAVALAWCMVVLLLPDSAGARLLGETWPHAEPLLPVLVVFWIAIGATLGATQGLLALGAAKRSLFTQVAGLAIQLPLMAAGAAVDGAAGAAVAAGLTAILRMLLAWAQFGRAVGERPTAAGEMARPQPLPEIATP